MWNCLPSSVRNTKAVSLFKNLIFTIYNAEFSPRNLVLCLTDNTVMDYTM